MVRSMPPRYPNSPLFHIFFSRQAEGRRFELSQAMDLFKIREMIVIIALFLGQVCAFKFLNIHNQPFNIYFSTGRSQW